MRATMAEASRIVLAGFELRTDVMRIVHPDRFMDPRGIAMWTKVTELISRRTNMPVPMAAEVAA